MQHSTPAAPAVRETLERLLASETFGRSERARKLLRYLVEREQAGEADRLKGFSIAMDVFGKDAEFDSSTDAVVRVQAGRLRELLLQYSVSEGAGDPLRIVIPRGSYVPAYEVHPAARPAVVNSQPATKPAAMEPGESIDGAARPAGPVLQRHLKFLWMAITLVIVMLGFLILRQAEVPPVGVDSIATSGESGVSTSSIPLAAQPQPVETLPQVYISIKTGGAEANRVAASLRAGLTNFDTVDFIGRDFSGPPDPVGDATSFVFELSTGPAPGGITLELQSVATGRVLLSRNMSPGDTAPGQVEDRIAGILSATVPASGTIYAYIEQNGSQTGLTACLLLNDDYYVDQNARTHEAAYRCLETLASQNARSPLVYAELASLHLAAITEHYAYPPGASTDQAAQLAHRALQMGATSPYAHRAYGYLNTRLGNPQESIRWMRKAYELNTYDLSMAAAYGYGLIFAGDYRDGTPIIARAVEASSAHPTWWDFGLFLGAFMLDDKILADRATGALTPTSAKSHYLAARLICAKAEGNEPLAKRLIDQLTADFPKFAANPRAAFVERNYPADLTDRLVGALHAAGLGSAS